MKSLSLIIVMENEILNHDNIIPPDFDDLNIMDALQEQDGRLENFEVEETSSEPEVMPDEEENVCKICRLPGEDSNPLYHPCKCSVRHKRSFSSKTYFCLILFFEVSLTFLKHQSKGFDKICTRAMLIGLVKAFQQ